MKRIFMWIGATVVGCALLVACEKDNSISTPGGGTGNGPSGTPDALVIARTFPGILANGLDQIEVRATVVDSRGRGVQNVGVFFATNHGTIEPYATTDNSGTARTKLTSEASVNNVTATVTARASRLTSTPGTVSPASAPAGAPLPADAVVIVSRTTLSDEAIQAALDRHATQVGGTGRTGLHPEDSSTEVIDQAEITMKGVTVTIAASPSVIPADGISTSQVTANVSETVSHVPLEGADVQFGATAGTITGHVETGTSGSAIATLTGLTSGSSSQITAFYGPTLKAMTTVSFSALSMTVSAGEAVLMADGMSTTPITARIVNAEKNPIQGVSVTFTTSLGIVTSPVLTDEKGEAVTMLRSAAQPGQATVRAAFGTVTQTVDVTFTSESTDALDLARSIPSILANGFDQATLIATVVDSRGAPLPNVPVQFATDHGSVVTSVTTGSTGEATAALTSEASAEDMTATVTATASPVHSALTATGSPAPIVIMSGRPLTPAAIRKAIEVRAQSDGSYWPGFNTLSASNATVMDQITVPMRGVTVTVTALPSVIPADGISSSRIVATVIETLTRVPVAGHDVAFGATLGSITGKATTDANGTAAATFTGLTTGTVSQITAFYGPTLSASTNVAFSALSMAITAGRLSMFADGASTTQITARLVTAEHNPVAGAAVMFTTDKGNVTSPIVTNDAGEAVATLTAGTTPGPATVQAAFGGTALNVQVNLLAMPVSTTILLSATPAAIPADGKTTATVVAQVLDANGDPMPDGTGVTFAVTAGGGSLVAPVQSMKDGQAVATYVAGTAPGSVTLQATSGVATKTFPLSLQSLGAVGLTLTTDVSSILADGLASAFLTAIVTDNFGNPVAAGTEVIFKTSRGEIVDAVPTNAAGVATARLKATARETGLARVTASVGAQVQKTVDVNFTSGDASVIEVVNLDHPSIGVDGAADYQTATVTYEVRDRSGIPVDPAHSVMVTFLVNPASGPLMNVTFFPATTSSNELGRVQTTVRSGTIAGAIEVRASIGQIVSRPVRVAIHGDLPDATHFGIAFAKLNIPGRVPIFGYRDLVTAYVGDRYGNPVPDSTAVWFTTTAGIVQGSGQTNDHGEASVDHLTANPMPATNVAGMVTITAQTMAKDGNRITTAGQVLWSGPTVLEITSPLTIDIPANGSINIIYKVHDDINNPLTGGTQITATTSAGILSGDTNVILADTQDKGSGTTDFKLVLADNADTPAGPVTVTIKVKSINGDATAMLSGAIH